MALLITLGVPEICPVDVLIANPAGRPGHANDNGGSPPDAVTGVNGAAVTFCTATLFDITCVVINAPGSTSKVNDLLVV